MGSVSPSLYVSLFGDLIWSITVSIWWCLQNPKYCDFYRFQKDYLDELILKKIVIIKCEQIEEVEEGSHGSMNDEEENRSRLEKLENLTWKMNCVFVVFSIVVLAMVVRSVLMA